MRTHWLGLLGVVELACSMPMPTARVVDAARSTVTASKTTALADGADTVTVLVTALDAAGAPVAGVSIAALASGEANALEAPPQANDDGQVMLSLRSTRAEAKRLTVTAQGVTLEAQPTVRFVPGPVATLRWDVQPANGRLGVALTPAPTLSATDAAGNTVDMTDVTVSLRLVRSQNGTLMGGAARSFTQGVARFDQLVVTGLPQTGCALRAEASNGTAAESVRFDVTP
ncbi:MAG: Ig-like domain-containing protein [Myxococcaceae bacterium]|jgi:hypothetical protein|nr:Ig-like domain-containing protein [Myxococcaceae bacterium]